jgi:hypothetical protein
MNAGLLWWYWPLALAFVAIVMFAIPEFLAIKFGGPTFSRFMATVRASPLGPIWSAAWGALFGGLLVHFSRWCMYNVQ